MNIPAFAAIVSSCVFFVFILSWFYFVLSNAYWIVLPGLKKVFYVFLAHSLFLSFAAIMAATRPFWQKEMAGYVWNNDAFCDIHGRFWTSCGLVGLFMTTLFSYFKMTLYVTLKENPGPCITAAKYSTIPGLILYALVFIIFFIFTKSGPQKYEGMKVCATMNKHVVTLNSLSCIIFLALNLQMTLVFFTLRKLRSDDFPAIQHQMNLNLYVMPPIFFTSVFLTFVNVVIAQIWKNNAMPWITHIGLADHIINNIIMYWSIFGYASHDFFGDPNDSTSNDFLNIEMVSNDDPEQIFDFEADSEIEPEFWVCLPGAHPLKVTETVLERNNLRRFIVSRASRLRQIKAYKKRGFIPSLSLCCSDTVDLMDNLKDMRAVADGNEDNIAGSSISELVDKEESKKIEHPRLSMIKMAAMRKSRLARNAKDDREDPKIILIKESNEIEDAQLGMKDGGSTEVTTSVNTGILME